MNVLYANDHPGKYPASYYRATVSNVPDHPVLSEHIQCDVCIIGAGYTGVSAALHLAQAGMEVVVLDAHRVGWGASGRNGGQLASGQRVEQSELEKMFGADKAMQLWRLGQEANGLVKQLIAEHHIDCDLTAGVIHANHRQRYTRHTRAEVDHLNSVYGYDKISFLSKQDIRTHLGTKAYFSGSLDMGAAHLHPLKLVLGLAKAASGAGVSFFERSKVVSLDQRDPAIVKTETGKVTAKFVLLACNGYLGDLQHRVSRHVMPINNFIIATEPLGREMAQQLIAQNTAVADSKFVINYYRLSRDNRLLFGGGENYSYKFPADIKAFVRKPMLQIYPQLHRAKIDYGWGGTLAITMKRLPYLKKLRGNILTAGGYSGEGIGMGIFSGALMARTILGTADKFDTMASLPEMAFPGGTIARAPLLALAMLYYSLRDRF